MHSVSGMNCSTNKKPSHKEDVNKTNEHGQTALHLITLITEELINQNYLNQLDCAKAHKAADLLMQGAKIDVKDNMDNTPFDNASLNQHLLPKLYQVIKAAKTMRESEPKSNEYTTAQGILVEHYLTMES